MSSKLFFVFFTTLSFVIGAIQMAAVRLSLYFEFPWLDIIMHILGGMWLTSAAFCFYIFSQKGRESFRKNFFIVALISVLSVAIIWEFIEIPFQVMPIPRKEYWSDTILDVFFGISGFMIAFFAIFRRYNYR